MHCGQMGFPQTAHLSVAATVRCFGQNREAGSFTGGGSSAPGADAILMRGAGGGVAAIDGAGAASATNPPAAASASYSRTSWLTYSDESSPQPGQTKRTGFRAMSGVMSKAYFAPQAHWIFMRV